MVASTLGALGKSGWSPRTRLATLVPRHDLLDGIRVLLRPCMVDLRHETGETANLLIREGEKILYIDQLESRHPRRQAGSVGRLVPLTGTASGAALSKRSSGETHIVSDGVETGVTSIARPIDPTMKYPYALSVTGPTARLHGAAIKPLPAYSPRRRHRCRASHPARAHNGASDQPRRRPSPRPRSR